MFVKVLLGCKKLGEKNLSFQPKGNWRRKTYFNISNQFPFERQGNIEHSAKNSKQHLSI